MFRSVPLRAGDPWHYLTARQTARPPRQPCPGTHSKRPIAIQPLAQARALSPPWRKYGTVGWRKVRGQDGL